ncbi:MULTISPECIES: DoxX family protein [Actinomadura]|uniref:Putative oxidoreductase n=2 Tax=Actinomadura madurae TaxID=1993 RepID=A0A1I5VX26_9ACTN|nr:DoxX family protein [Actinomadura madurae]MCP9966222.1 DoxX family protein [Actinomadura madurae]MCQ0009765.1 DoxX family protein [Actinomadura madurae]URM95011.1 DoxX family protein [Actinomadura madurae]URN05733.1 DoxX family protein [Actinomadura madurae]SFQ12025.1 putative oxidoreductase [Actinomadura madurae]
MRSRPLYDVVAVLARLGVGVVFMAHGWQKIEAGVTATSRTFDTLGVPLPTAAAVYSAFVELLGGAALIAGLGLPVTGALLFIDMAGAFVFVHADQGLFMVDGTTVQNGYELVLALGMASLVFAAGGGGRLTLDQWVIGRRGRHPADDDDDNDAASFVESLRQAEMQPAKRPRSPRRPKNQPEPPALPEGTDTAAKDPADTEDDVLVAGRRKSQRRRAATTQPIKRGDDKNPTT